jgi:hypothetical protein
VCVCVCACACAYFRCVFSMAALWYRMIYTKVNNKEIKPNDHNEKIIIIPAPDPRATPVATPRGGGAAAATLPPWSPCYRFLAPPRCRPPALRASPPRRSTSPPIPTPDDARSRASNGSDRQSWRTMATARTQEGAPLLRTGWGRLSRR